MEGCFWQLLRFVKAEIICLSRNHLSWKITRIVHSKDVNKYNRRQGISLKLSLLFESTLMFILGKALEMWLERVFRG